MKITLVNFTMANFSYLQNNGQCWFAGAHLTFADFIAWEILDQHRLLVPGCLDKLETLGRYIHGDILIL